MSDMETRRQLLVTVQRDDVEMEHALDDLRRAVGRPFAIGDQVGERLGAHPLPWLFASVLLGVWWGSRRS